MTSEVEQVLPWLAGRTSFSAISAAGNDRTGASASAIASGVQGLVAAGGQTALAMLRGSA